jgi:hypothetical protein
VQQIVYEKAEADEVSGGVIQLVNAAHDEGDGPTLCEHIS